MQDDFTKPTNETEAKPRTRKNRKPFATFLMESEIRPLVFVGRCMQYFGLGAVIGFLLGAVGVYGYAFVVKSLPLITFTGEQPVASPTPTPGPVTNAMRKLHGRIKSNNKPISEDIEIGVLLKRQGPFQSGTYSIEVPDADRYQLTFWNAGYRTFRLVEVIPNSDGTVGDVDFPSEMSAARNRDSDIYARAVGSKPMPAATRMARDHTSFRRSRVANHGRFKRSPL